MTTVRGLAAGETLAFIPASAGTRRGTHTRPPVHAATVIDGALVPVCGARGTGQATVKDASSFARTIECRRCKARAAKAGRL
jgi:hypothetical protein